MAVQNVTLMRIETSYTQSMFFGAPFNDHLDFFKTAPEAHRPSAILLRDMHSLVGVR